MNYFIISCSYRLIVEYRIGFRPEVWLLEPSLKKWQGKLPHHLYPSQGTKHPDLPKLCVYSPKHGEWNGNMLLAKSFFPWIATWLNTYEFWIIIGEWNYAEFIAETKI